MSGFWADALLYSFIVRSPLIEWDVLVRREISRGEGGGGVCSMHVRDSISTW